MVSCVNNVTVQSKKMIYLKKQLYMEKHVDVYRPFVIWVKLLLEIEDHKILTDLQHGFRSGRSCETQL